MSAATLIAPSRTPCARSARRARPRSASPRASSSDAEVVEQVGRLLAQRARRTPRAPARATSSASSSTFAPIRSGPARKQLGRVAALRHARAGAAASVRASAGSASCDGDRRLAERAVEAGALAGVAGRAGRLDQRQQRVRVAVVAQRAQPLHVARGLALVPQLVARAAPEVRPRRSRACARAPRGSCRRASAPRPSPSPGRRTGRGRRSSNAICGAVAAAFGLHRGYSTEAASAPPEGATKSGPTKGPLDTGVSVRSYDRRYLGLKKACARSEDRVRERRAR